MTPPIQANANIAIEQQGNKWLLGGATPFGVEIDYTELQALLSGANVPVNHVGFGTDFLGAAISTQIATNLSTGATFAINSQVGGAARLATDTDDDDFGTVAVGLNWSPVNGPLVMVARARQNSAITLRHVEIGISDALSEAAGMAFSSISTPTAVATDAVVMAIDSDESLATWTTVSVKNGGTPQKVAGLAAAAPVAGTYQVFKLIIDTSGTAYAYVDGVLIATITNAITVSASVPLSLWISLHSLSGAIKSMDLDFIAIYGAR